MKTGSLKSISRRQKANKLQDLTGIDRVPVPQHLAVVSVDIVCGRAGDMLTEILQVGPSPIPIPIPIPPMSMLSEAEAIAADAVELMDAIWLIWSIVEDGMLMAILLVCILIVGCVRCELA